MFRLPLPSARSRLRYAENLVDRSLGLQHGRSSRSTFLAAALDLGSAVPSMDKRVLGPTRWTEREIAMQATAATAAHRRLLARSLCAAAPGAAPLERGEVRRLM
jgi:hypothetical protein